MSLVSERMTQFGEHLSSYIQLVLQIILTALESQIAKLPRTWIEQVHAIAKVTNKLVLLLKSRDLSKTHSHRSDQVYGALLSLRGRVVWTDS